MFFLLQAPSHYRICCPRRPSERSERGKNFEKWVFGSPDFLKIDHVFLDFGKKRWRPRQLSASV